MQIYFLYRKDILLLLNQTKKMGKMKRIDFRIVELPTHQVLLTKDFDEDDNDKPMTVITLFLEGVKCSLKLGYDTEEKRDKMFDDFNEVNAQGILDAMVSQFEL